MIEYDQIKTKLAGYAEPLKEIRASLDVEGKEKRIEELHRLMEEPGFWDEPERSTKQMQELKSLESDVEKINLMDEKKEDIETLLELGYEENTLDLLEEIQSTLEEFENLLDALRLKTLLAEEYDCNVAFRKIANIAVVGRNEPVVVYNPMAQDDYESKKAVYADFDEAYKLFVAGKFAEAKVLFDQNTEDPVSEKYSEKCKMFLEIPPEKWKGFLQATQK